MALDGFDEITLEQRDDALKDISLREGGLFKKYKRDPLTLKLQDTISKRVGRGGVNAEFKAVNRIKKKTRNLGLFELQKERDFILDIPIIESIPSPFEIDVGTDL